MRLFPNNPRLFFPTSARHHIILPHFTRSILPLSNLIRHRSLVNQPQCDVCFAVRLALSMTSSSCLPFPIAHAWTTLRRTTLWRTLVCPPTMKSTMRISITSFVFLSIILSYSFVLCVLFTSESLNGNQRLPIRLKRKKKKERKKNGDAGKE